MPSLQQLHTFGFPARCRSLQIIHSPADAKDFAKSIGHEHFLFLGGGSNCAFIEDFDGVVAQVQIMGIEIAESADAYRLMVGAGENWHQFVSWTLENNMQGLENLALIPGTVGAAPIQNIGAYGVEASEYIQWVEYVEIGSGELVRLTNKECQFAYRESIFKLLLRGKALITRVCFELPKYWQPKHSYAELKQMVNPSAKAIFDEVIKVRQRKLPDPTVQGNAGSFFKNPVIERDHLEQLKSRFADIPFFHVSHDKSKVPAAWLIDILGYKGQRRGGIMCHNKQALVLVNCDQQRATGLQLFEFATEIQAKVAEQFNIHLIPEVQLIGQKGLLEL